MYFYQSVRELAYNMKITRLIIMVVLYSCLNCIKHDVCAKKVNFILLIFSVVAPL